MCERLKDLLPRQQFDIAIQAAIGGKIVARVECGLCSYVCTSHIRVTDYIRRAKMFAKTK